MVASNYIIQKMIQGSLYCYNREFDRISMGINVHNGPARNSLRSRVDLCCEITTACNFSCLNCFSYSSNSDKRRKFASLKLMKNIILELAPHLIRVCISGGEPLLHPNLESILEFPTTFDECGFILLTNGSLRPELDRLILANNWSIAISLHGMRNAHNLYTKSQSFEAVVNRLSRLSASGIVHIYTVLHDGLSIDEIDWLFKFRDEVGACLLRFTTPRPFGRYQHLTNMTIFQHVKERLDHRSVIITRSSNTIFIDVNGLQRSTN
jgi:molybdenum cofactor biosynthesis enzyme MoaA